MVRKLKSITAVLLLTSFLLAPCASAWNNDYSPSQSYDSYSQSWQNYKQQNNINTQTAYQQSWWNSAINSIGNFFSSVGNFVSNVVTNIGNFCTNIYNNVHDFFIKTPEIKANLATAPPTKEPDAINRVSTSSDITKSLSDRNNINDTAKADTYKAQTNQKNNPYAYLTAEKACYDPRAAGLSQFSSQYQAIEAEYAARDKWVASQQTQQAGEGKLADAGVKTIPEPPVNDTNIVSINQKDISVIAPAQVTHPDPSIMPAESWDRVKQTLPVDNTAPKQTILTTTPQKETYIVPLDIDKYNPEEIKNADTEKFYDVFPPSQNVTVKQIADKMMTDFSTHNDFIPGASRNIEGAKDILQRAAGVVISSVSSDAAEGVAKRIGAGEMVSKGVGKAADMTVSNAMDNSQIKLLDNERIVFKNTCDKINNELFVGAVQSFSFQRNIITDNEAAWRNNFEKTATTLVGFIPIVGTAISMIKTQPYEGGQIEYRVQFDYLKDAPQSKLWRVDLEYRTGDYFTSSGTRERGVIESKYTQSYYDPQYGFVTEEGHHAP